MYYITSVNQRPNRNLPFYSDSSVISQTTLSDYTESLTAVGADHSIIQCLNATGLVAVNVEKWTSLAAYTAWATENADAISAYIKGRDAYNLSVGIVHSETKNETPDSLF